MTRAMQAETFWRGRGNEAAKAYWDTRDAQYRALIVDNLRQLQPFGRILEVGCQSGPNLWAIRQQFPDVHLVGMDPSSHAVMFGAAMCELGRICHVDFFEGLAPDGIPAIVQAVGEPDIVLSIYTLTYLQDEAWSATLAACCDAASKAVVLAEPMNLGQEPLGLIETPPGRCPSWRHDYAAWFTVNRPDWIVTARKLPRVQEMNGLVIARRP